MTTHPRRLGVEEELHLVDLGTRRLTARAPELLRLLPPGTYVPELQRSVVEINSDVVDDLTGLHAELTRRRALLADVAGSLGVGAVAAGTVPLVRHHELAVTDSTRFRHMEEEYQLLSREQLICGSQVHVDVADRDEAIMVSHRVAPYLPVFLALSAGSPFSESGTDTGYASSRTLIWSRWPTTGPVAPAADGAEYDRLVADLIASGVITDPGMLYYDLRPSSAISTLELRVCDSCTDVDTLVLVAGLFRALVEHETRAHAAGRAPLVLSPAMMRAAQWRAARSGLEGDLIDVGMARPRPAADVVSSLIDLVEPELVDSGDLAQVRALADRVVLRGTSAQRQRIALRRRGRLEDVVDALVLETAPAATVLSDGPTPAEVLATRPGGSARAAVLPPRSVRSASAAPVAAH